MVSITSKDRSKGVTTVEAAIVLPLVLALTLGTIEYGWVLLKKQQITNAARHTARVAVRPDCLQADTDAAAAMLMSASGISNYTVSYSPGIAVEPGETVTVTISVNKEEVLLGGPFYVPVPDELVGTVSMAKEGP